MSNVQVNDKVFNFQLVLTSNLDIPCSLLDIVLSILNYSLVITVQSN